MPEPKEKAGVVEKSFFDKLSESKVKTQAPATFAEGNLTGITSANSRYGARLEGHYKDLNAEVGLDRFSTPKAWEQVGLSSQSILDVATNTFYGGMTNLAAGAIEGVAGNDMLGVVSMAFGLSENKFGNILHDWSADLLEYSSENYHLYQNKNESPFSFAYWGQQLQTTGYSVGIIAEMFAEAALLKRASGSSMKALAKGSKFLSNPGVFGSFQGVKEAYLNGLQTGEETYRKYIDIGYDKKTAQKKANEASTLGFRMEVLPLMTMNALQFASLGKYNPFMKKEAALGFSGGFETMSEYAFKKVKNKYLKKLADYGTNMVGEAIEEGIQTGISKQAQYEIGLADGIVNKKTLDERLFDDHEMRDSMFGGALGGGMFRFMGKRYNHLTKGSQVKRQQGEYDNFLSGIAQRVGDDTKELYKATEEGNQEKVDVIRKKMQRNNVLEALQYDMMNQSESGFETYVSSLEQIKEGLATGDVKVMESYGITTPKDVEHILKNIDVYIKDAHTLKDKLINTLETTDDFNAALQITDASKTVEELTEFETRSNKVITDFKNENKIFQSLSDNGKQQFDLLTERGALVAKAKYNSITQGQRDRIDVINTELTVLKEAVKGSETAANDQRKLKSLDATSIIKEKVSIHEMEDHQGHLADKLAYWNNKDNQKQERVKRAKRRVSKSKSKESLIEAKEDLAKDDVLTAEVEEKINAKIKQAEVEELANAGKENESFNPVAAGPIETGLGTVVTPTAEELAPNKDRGDKADQIIDNLKMNSTGDAIIVSNDDLFEPARLGDFSAKQLEKLGDLVNDYKTSLEEDLGKVPSFEEFIRDFIKNNTKESTERAYHALTEGWKVNNFPAADYAAVYSDIFKDRKEMTSDILNVAEEMIATESVEDVVTNNEEVIVKTVQKAAPVVALKNNNQPILKDTSPYRTSTPTLKAAHLSIPYRRELVQNEKGEMVVVDTDTSEDLNNASDVKSTKLLDPDGYGEGTTLTVKVPENYKTFKVSTRIDDFTSGPAVSFEKWEEMTGNTEGSQAWIEKVPMVAVDSNGDSVFMIHDNEWYNPINTGLKEDPAKQAELISDARKNLTEFRSKVLQGPTTIEITEKRPGTFKTVSKGQPLLTLNQANPETQLAIASESGELKVGKVFFNADGKNLLNVDQDFTAGHTYDIRKIKGNDYMAFKVHREQLTPEVTTSILKASSVYLFQFDENSLASNKEQIAQTRDEVLKATGLDLFNVSDFESYLNLFINTVTGKFNSVLDIYNTVEKNTRIPHGTPYVSLQSRSLVFGIKGQPYSEKRPIRYINPRKITDQGGPALMKGVLNDFTKMLGRSTQNISKKGLIQKRSIALISEDNSVSPMGDYENFLKQTLKTNVKSFNVGTPESPIYATAIQPTLNYKIVTNAVQENVAVVESTVAKIVNKEPLTKTESVMAQESPRLVQEKTQEARAEIPVNEIEVLKEALRGLREMGVSEDDASIQYILESLGEDSDFQPVQLSDEMVANMKSKLESIEGLSILQEFQLVDFVFNEITSKLDFKYKSAINKAILLKEIKDSYFTLIEPKRDRNIATIKNLQTIVDAGANARMSSLIEKMEEEVKIFSTIKDNWSEVENKAIAKLQKYTGITEAKMDSKEITDASTEQEKNYSKSSLEENGKTTASYRLKRFLAGIKQVDVQGKNKPGFLGVETYVGFDTAYEVIGQILASPYEVNSSYEEFVVRLKENVNIFPWLKQVLTELDDADQQIKNELVYELTKHTLSMKFVMFSQNRDESYTLKVYDTNANEITRIIKNQWGSNFKQGSLTYVEDGLYKVKKERAAELLTQFEAWSTQVENGNLDIPTADLRHWLASFGIALSNETIEEMKSKPITYMTKYGEEKMTFSKMFRKTNRTAGIFGLLGNYLEGIVTKADTAFEENPENHPFNDASGVLSTLSKIESKYSTFATVNSFRDGDKLIYGFTPTKHTTDVAKDLKYNQEFRDALLEKSFNKHSYMLNLLNTDPAFAEKFYIDHLGITSLKELGKKTFGDNSITGLSDSDHELTKLGLFQDTEQGEVEGSLGTNNFVNLRMARMFMPTMSDKSQMLAMHTAVLDLNNKHFIVQGDNSIFLQKELIAIMYTQLVKPELERIYKFASTIKKTNIKDYDMAAQMFLMIPEMNNLIDKQSGERALALMINAPQMYNMEWFENTFSKEIESTIQNLVASEVSSKMTEWEEAGFFEVQGDERTTTVKFLNNKYLERFKGDNITKVKLAANDFVVNSLLTNANVFMMIAGDIAMYSQGKINKYFQDGKAYLPKEEFVDTAYSKAVKEVISVNVGKRLALMLAPGNKIANSRDAKYSQIFLNDHIDISSNIETLVGLYYNEEAVTYAKRNLKRYNEAKTSVERRSIAKELSTKFPEIADYFDIEATDAQEYTTISEHLLVLEGQGRLSSEEVASMREKIAIQTQAEAEGRAIPDSAMLNYNELKLVLQPVKPVHTGFKNEPHNDAMRMMYIKSSSFPLLPQVTKGTELDKLRKLMENFEKVKGRSVRASYQTANKVGAVTTAITPFNPDGTFNDSITVDQILEASLTLDRDNFRIQQDVPFKSEKRSEDVVSLGTQVLKLLFGDGMLKLDGFMFEGESLTGMELKDKFNDNFDNYVAHKKKVLFNQIGVDHNGQPIDVEVTMNKLQVLLRREAEERGYPKQDIEALNLSPVLDSQGNVVNVDFSIPLWLSPNSNRYEALLNAIVSNKVINLKIPGNSFVVGSEAGFRMQKDLSGIDQSRIIYTNAYQGELKAAEYNEDGSLKKAQIMVPSKFRDNAGNLIEFIDKNGKINETYLERDENGILRIKEGMIAEELLNITSFRIPTSAHVSMTQLEIVGILPTEVGDLMIVPRNLTKQKGLDFDVDKETTYQLHTFIGSEGEIKTLTEEDRLTVLKAADTMVGKDWLKDQSQEAKLLRAIFGEDPDFTLDDFNSIEDGSKLDRVNEKFDQKIMENKFVKAHASVLSNPNKEVQKKINKVLSMDFAQGQAELVQNATEKDVDNKYFSMLSDSFQKNKMFLGASGKLGIGVYSNYVVFHSMAQQATRPIQLMTQDEYGNQIPQSFTIGDQTSKGILGLQGSLAKGNLKRNIAEAFAERQNTATDNEKEQIMGRLNINEVTINVDSLMTALGFDKDVLNDGTEVSIPYLLMSQPVIKEFVKELRKTKSNTTEFDGAAEMKVIQRLKTKFAPQNSVAPELAVKMLTGQAMYNNLDETKINNVIQTAAFNTFLELRDYAQTLGAVQSRLNINKNGLGKSFFETIDKYDGVQKAILSAEMTFRNISGLVGDYIPASEVTALTEPALLAEGYVKLDKQYIKPTTPVGSMLVHSVQAGHDMWKGFFPYNEPGVKAATEEILKSTSSQNTSEQKVIQIKQDIFKEMKKYMVSSQMLGLFEGDPQIRRKELFLDTENNVSLASYLNELVNSDDKKFDFLRGNKLLSRFQYNIQKNGLPSTIKFDNTKGENFDEDYLYMALVELLEENRNLPEKNGQGYSTRQLAQDLVAYTYLEGGIQEAVQFAKYIPVSYLDTIPFAANSREWNGEKNQGIFGTMLGISAGDADSRFTRQFVQHNPQKLPKVDALKNTYGRNYSGKSKDLADLASFQLDLDTLTAAQAMATKDANYISIYNPKIQKGLKKFQIYQRTGNLFVRVSSLGVFGMSEYSIKSNDVVSIVNPTHRVSSTSKKINTEKAPATDVFNIQAGSVSDVLNNISNYNFEKYPHLKPVADAIKEFAPNDLKISVADILNSKGQRIARGSYKDQAITIDSEYFKTAETEELAKTVIHEVIHGLTTDYLKKYVDKQGNYITENVPTEVINLVILFNEAKKHLGAEIDSYAVKRDQQLSGESNEASTEREATVAYGGTNIREFVTLIMTEPNFQKEMSKIKYQATNQTLMERFSAVVDSIMKKVLGDSYGKNNVTTEGVKVTISLIEKQAKMQEQSRLENMDETNRSLEASLDNSLGEVIIPTDDEINPFEDSDKNPTFGDPFKCK